MSVPAAGLFPPEDPERAAVLDVVHTSPILWGHARTRWTLALLGETSLLLHSLSLSGRWRRLACWRLARKRSRDRLRSPDPAYQAKVAIIAAARAQAAAHPATQVVLYGDEFTYYRQPAPALAYVERGAGGRHQPLAHRSYRSNTKRRVIGALDSTTGQVHWHSASKIGVAGLKKHLRQLRQAYGPTRDITLVWDNWPVHAHAAVQAVAATERITVVWLPTYAPWLNYIEKLWDWLKAEVLRLHPWSDAWDVLHTKVAAFLLDSTHSATALLRYVGLLPTEPTKPQAASP